MPTTHKTAPRGRRLGRKAWLIAARDALISGGVETIKIDRLATTLSANRGSFYHHFKNRDSLLNELILHWKLNNTLAYETSIDLNNHNGASELNTINNIWLEENSFDPKYDIAVRDWARTDEKIARVVRYIDEKRINILHSIYTDLGYLGDSALVRARIAYFQQVGYLTLGLGENLARRNKLAPLYLEALLGR